MIRVVGIILEHEGLFVNGKVTALADEFAQALGLLSVVARPAEMPVESNSERGDSNPPSTSSQNSLDISWKRKSGILLGRSVMAG